MPHFTRSSSSSVETHNSLSVILGTNLNHIDRPKTQTPELKHEMSSGSPCDSGISGSSWTNDGVNSRTKWTGGVNGDGGTSNSSTRSTSVLSDCVSGPASLKTDTVVKNVEMNHTSPFSDRNISSSMESKVPEERQLYSSEVKLIDFCSHLNGRFHLEFGSSQCSSGFFFTILPSGLFSQVLNLHLFISTQLLFHDVYIQHVMSNVTNFQLSSLCLVSS